MSRTLSPDVALNLPEHRYCSEAHEQFRDTLAWARTLLEDLAWRVQQGERPVAQLAMLKNFATQTMQFCADQAVQILGGAGCMRGTRPERIYREAKVMMIGGGAEEIMKDLAARQMG